MRFLPNGPKIPDELLEARDQGEVVFLCGAGVSYPAGMPTFLGLTEYVVKGLVGTDKDTPAWAMLSRCGDENIPADQRPSLDKVFGLLRKDFTADDINALIEECLETNPEADFSAHETILRLSKGGDDQPQIVTTNFDLLFEEAAGRQLTTYAYPSLPNLAAKQSINGLVYLHGRISPEIRQEGDQQRLVVSSADFGRAYLADGWATDFMRDLLDRYVVVLLGYSANDPPVRYLLEGLSNQGYGNRDSLFTFDSGTEEEVQERWKDRGVQALAYPEDDKHSALWKTLSAWADRADNPRLWRRRIVDLAKQGPRNLEPHERGQVASLVRTDIGAKLFADTSPPLSGEWLCVFDHRVRYGRVGRSSDGTQPNFDPLAEYGLDEDPPRPPSTWGQTGHSGDDLLSLRTTERPTNTSTRLAGPEFKFIAPLPPRLTYLADWIVKIAHEPVAPWWAAKYPTLHPYLLGWIERRVRQANDETLHLTQPIWKLLIEKFRAPVDDAVHSSWYGTLDRIETEGWTNGVLRSFEQNSTPYLKVTSFSIAGSRPPLGPWSEIHWDRIVEFEPAFPSTRHKPPEIPNDILPAVYQILRRHLELAAGLLEDIGARYWQTATFYPEAKPGEPYLSERNAYLLWFRSLFDCMVEAQPELLRADIALWPQEEPFFFNKLRLWVWTFETLFSGDEVADGLLSSSDEAFWKKKERRELLWLLRRRWRDLPTGKRERLEQRVVDGRARYDGEGEDDYNQDRSGRSAAILGWLIIQGCELSDDTQKALSALRSADPRWCPEWDETADESYDGKGGSVRTDSDPSRILNVPLDQIVPLAKEYTRRPFGELTDYRPFDGLVKKHLSRAVAALMNAARHDCYPVEFWRAAMHNWPNGTRQRLVWLFGARLARLPSEIVFKLRGDAFFWINKRLPALAAQDQLRALSILDVLLNKLFEGEAEAAEEGSRDAQSTARPPDRSRKSFERVPGSPVGLAAELLIDLVDSQNIEKGSGLPSEITLRLERLIAAPGEGSDHAVHTIARQLRWLDSIDPEWTRRTIVPLFNFEHPSAEPAWNGFLFHDGTPPEPELFSLLKCNFLKAFSYALKDDWNDHVSRHLHKFLVIGCFWHQNNPVYISFEEVRRALRQTDNKGRAHTIYVLSIIVHSKVWTSFGKPFLEKAWPKEMHFRTEQTSQMFVAWAAEAGDLFPDVVHGIRLHLAPISDHDMYAHNLVQQHDGEGSELPRRFPDDALALLDKLVPDNPDRIPYGLDTAIEMIAEAKPSLRRDDRWRRLESVTLRR